MGLLFRTSCSNYGHCNRHFQFSLSIDQLLSLIREVSLEYPQILTGKTIITQKINAKQEEENHQKNNL
jgi:hypothetical protein